MGPFFRWGMVLFLATLFIMVVIHKTNAPSTIHEALWSASQYIMTEEEELDNLDPIQTPRGNITYAEIEREVFKPLGYKIKQKTIIPALDYINEPNCPKVFTEWLERSEKQNESGKPPMNIPSDLFNEYTLNNYTHLIMAYMDDRSGTHSATWRKQDIERYLNSEVQNVQNYAGEGRGIYHAMNEHIDSITGKRGIVIGSLSPWVESFPLRLNASHVTTIEYMKIQVIDYPRLDYKHPVEIAKEYEKHIGAYDWAASFSSLEHSGLGRFGDALDPIGDLKESLKTYCMLKKGGYFFLGLPFGYDTVHWNLHRIYGRIRFAMMAAGFELINMFHIDYKVPLKSEYFAKPVKEGDHKQYVMALRKR